MRKKAWNDGLLHYVAKKLGTIRYRLHPGPIRLSGPYPSWETAAGASKGYNSDEILSKVREAALKVKSGEAVFERDSMLFHDVSYSFPLLAGMLRVAAEHDGNLSVLDFGGSLGSNYYRHRAFLSGLKRVQWSIVEQKAFVDCGRSEFQDDVLQFYHTIEECLTEQAPRVVLMSSVLQYLPDPYTLLLSLPPTSRYLILDMVPISLAARDRYYVQNVSSSIYVASYPFRIFSRLKFETALSNNFDKVCEFQTLPFQALEYRGGKYLGILCKRICEN